MNIAEMAREAGFKEHNGMIYATTINDDCAKELERFAALVAADERNSWPAEMEAMERQVNILTDALAQEREACAKVCEELHPGLSSKRVAEIIRARSNT